MNVTDYDNITSSNYIDLDKITSANYTDYDNMTLTDRTINENNIDINIPTLSLTIPCGLSISCLMILMVYAVIKALINNK